MEHFAGIDVSLEQSSVCVVDATGKIVREAKVASEPRPTGSPAITITRIADLTLNQAAVDQIGRQHDGQ